MFTHKNGIWALNAPFLPWGTCKIHQLLPEQTGGEGKPHRHPYGSISDMCERQISKKEDILLKKWQEVLADTWRSPTSRGSKGWKHPYIVLLHSIFGQRFPSPVLPDQGEGQMGTLGGRLDRLRRTRGRQKDLWVFCKDTTSCSFLSHESAHIFWPEEKVTISFSIVNRYRYHQAMAWGRRGKKAFIKRIVPNGRMTQT